jgi:hypothetical protein
MGTRADHNTCKAILDLLFNRLDWVDVIIKNGYTATLISSGFDKIISWAKDDTWPSPITPSIIVMILVMNPERKEIVQMDPDGMMTAIWGSSRVPGVLKSSWMESAFNCSTYPIRIAFPRRDVAVTSPTRPSPQIVLDSTAFDDLIGIRGEITYVHLHKSEYRLVHTKLGTKEIGAGEPLFEIAIQPCQIGQ